MVEEPEIDGMIKRKVYSKNAIRAEYLITRKGRMLRSIVEQMAAFSLSYCSESIENKERQLAIEL